MRIVLLTCCVWWCYHHHHANICQIQVPFSCFRCNSNSKQSVSQCSAHARFCCGWGVIGDREHCDLVVDHAGVTPCPCSSLKPLGHNYNQRTNLLTPIPTPSRLEIWIWSLSFCLVVLLSFCLLPFGLFVFLSCCPFVLLSLISAVLLKSLMPFLI